MILQKKWLHTSKMNMITECFLVFSSLSDTVWAYQLSTILIRQNFIITVFMDPSFAHTLNPLQPCLFKLVIFICAEAHTTLIIKLRILYPVHIYINI